jgi:hypothetical protein
MFKELAKIRHWWFVPLAIWLASFALINTASSEAPQNNKVIHIRLEVFRNDKVKEFSIKIDEGHLPLPCPQPISPTPYSDVVQDENGTVLWLRDQANTKITERLKFTQPYPIDLSLLAPSQEYTSGMINKEGTMIEESYDRKHKLKHTIKGERLDKYRFVILDENGIILWKQDFVICFAGLSYKMDGPDIFTDEIYASSELNTAIPYDLRIARLHLYKENETLIYIKDFLPEPRALYFGKPEDAILKATRGAGFHTFVADKFYAGIEVLKRYQLVTVVSYDVCSRLLADALKEFIAQGGGAILYSGVPAMLPHTPPPPGGTSGFNDISYVAEWFGAKHYTNIGGKATLTKTNPFKTKLPSDSLLEASAGGSCAGIAENSLEPGAKVIAKWEQGAIYAFTYRYKDGRVYYQAYEGGEIGSELIRGAALWVTNRLPTPKPTPELVDQVNKLITELGAENWQTREKATKELIEIGEPALIALKQAQQHTDPEVRLRVKLILESLEEP